MRNATRFMAVAAALSACVSAAHAVDIETVTVGNPGNPGELSGAGAGGSGPDVIVGGVDYVYNIGKYEVTAGQYAEFLNSVAATDTYQLYNTSMWYANYGCKIQRHGTSGSYWYSVAADWADRPVNHVSWFDALRFANWLHNGQPTGMQGPPTTEDGAYRLNGYMGSTGSWITRKPGATWVVPTEDEWYKAAYYDGDATLYYEYPTGTDTAPNNGNPEGDTGNSANFNDGDFTIGSPYYRTEAGFFQLSASPYGTFDEGGNVAEWNETLLVGVIRGMRGGHFTTSRYWLRGSARWDGAYPADEASQYGFRVAEVPKPATLFLDIKPGSCPNPLNRWSHGVLPVALVGTEDFNVMEIDVSSVRLWRADGIGGEVAPNEGPPGPHSVFEDVATPFEGELCDCHELGGDGIVDLLVKFKTDDVVEALLLDDLPAGAMVELVVTGSLLDGTPFEGSDCVRLVPPGTPGALLAVESGMAGAWIDVDPLDETLDGGGFTDFERTFPLTTVVTLTAEEWADGRPLRGWQIGGLLHHMGDTSVEFAIDQDMAARAVYGPTPSSGSPKPDPTAPESFIPEQSAEVGGTIDRR